MYKNIMICFFLVLAELFTQNLIAQDAWEARHNQLQPIKIIAEAIALKRGAIVGEIGAGRGRYTVQLAKYVGPGGLVYANDIDTDALNYLKFRCQRDSIDNINIIKGAVKDPLFPKGALDMVFMVNTYHHIDYPVALLTNTIPALKPGATLVIVEATPEKNPDWADHHTARKKLLKEASASGLQLVRIETFLKKDDIYIFQVKKQ